MLRRYRNDVGTCNSSTQSLAFKVPSHTRSLVVEISAVNGPSAARVSAKPVEFRLGGPRGGISTAVGNISTESVVTQRGDVAAGTGGGEVGVVNSISNTWLYIVT
jgi:hypothetical protein